MKIKILVKICLLSIVISSPVYAEYYLVYPAPAPVCCVRCCQPRCIYYEYYSSHHRHVNRNAYSSGVPEYEWVGDP